MNVEKAETHKILIGMFIIGVASASLAVFIFYKVGLIREFSVVFSTQFLSGREMAMLHGASRNISIMIMVLVSFITDICGMLIGLPIFIFFYEELKTIPFMTPFMTFSEIITSKKSGVLHKFGLVGLFFICFIPFQMTGALATACFAKLLGFALSKILPVVTVASFTASVFWALTADTLMKYLEPVQKYMPFFIVLAVIYILVYNFIHYKKK